MQQSDYKRARELSSYLKNLSAQPRSKTTKKKAVKSPFYFPYQALKGNKVIIKKAPIKTKVSPLVAPQFKVVPSLQEMLPPPGTTHEEVRLMIEEYLRALPEPVVREDEEITEDFVREFIRVMRKLPEKDRIEIQDIRNWQSFRKDGIKYKFEELMHGGAGQTVTTNVTTQYSLTGIQSGNDVVVSLSQLTNFATLIGVIVAYRNQIPQTQGVTCNITTTSVTFFGADASEVFSMTYAYTS